MEPDVGDVGAKDLEGDDLIEFSLKLIIEYTMFHCLLHNRFVWILSSHFSDEVILSHNPLYLLVIHLWVPHFKASPAIFALSFVKDLFHFEVIIVVIVW